MPITTEKKIEKGYKQTEIGMIPEDWSCLKIPEITLPTATSIKIGPFGSALKKEYLKKTGFKVYGQENVYERDMSLGDRFLSPSHFKELKSCEIVTGDFLVSMMGTVGECMVVPNGIEAGIMDSHLLRIRFDKNKVDLRFIYQLFSTKIVFDQIKQLSVGGIMEGLSSKIIKSIYFPIPSKREQIVIADMFADTDAIITRMKSLIAKKKNIKQGAMQELLTGKKRLPGFSDEWKEVILAENFTLKARIGWQGLTTSEYLSNGNYFLVTGTDFIEGRVNWMSCWFVDKGRYVQDKNIQLKVGDILLTKDGTIGKVGFVDSLPRPATLNSGVFVIRPKINAYYPKFIFYIFKSSIFDNFLAKLQAGSTISHLYQKDFVNFQFFVPEFNEQVAIANVFSDIDVEIEKLESQLFKFQNIKQGMMQTLLTGKIRLVK